MTHLRTGMRIPHRPYGTVHRACGLVWKYSGSDSVGLLRLPDGTSVLVPNFTTLYRLDILPARRASSPDRPHTPRWPRRKR